MLKLSHVSKIYQNEKKNFQALDDVSLSFEKNEFVSILGPSGCGKTTLLNLIGGLDSISSGDIYLDGISIAKMKEGELNTYRNAHIGFIFQNYYLIPQLNVLDNVKIALSIHGYAEKEAKEKAQEILEKLQISFLAKKKVNQLSGGQAQRVAIARALITNPSIVLADEPTGALDSESSKQILTILKEISKDHLVIVVTHNQELAYQYSDRIIKMGDGKLVSDESLNQESHSALSVKETKQSKLDFRTSAKIAFGNILTRKAKVVLSSIASSFALIGIAFLLAVNHGFSIYSNKVSEESASSLPIVAAAYSEKNDDETFASTNASTLFPDTQEVYPYVDYATGYGYSCNYFSPKYIAYLDELQKQGLIKEYIKAYSRYYNWNLSTVAPASIDGSATASYIQVNTSINSSSSYASRASLPTNIFHVLYGDMNQYDVLAGELPKKQNRSFTSRQ